MQGKTERRNMETANMWAAERQHQSKFTSEDF